MTRSNWLIAVVAALALCVGGFLLSPWWSLSGLARAAITADKQRLTLYVDFPRVRESLRAQINAQMAASVAKDLKDNPFAALGTLLGSAMVDKAVEAFVTPDGLTRLFEEAMRDQRTDGDPTPSRADTARKLYDTVGLEWLSTSAVKVLVYGDQDQIATTLLLERSGLTWRVVDIELPDFG